MALSDSFLQHFCTLKDPRLTTHRNKRHLLLEILALTILAVLCGAESWVDVEHFGRAKKDWLKTFLELPGGIPSHDTIGRVFALLAPEQLQHCFIAWINSLIMAKEGEIVAIDGKTLRRSHDKSRSRRALHMMSAWAVKQRVVLGQIRKESDSNEAEAIPQLLEILDLKGTTVTIDAAGCYKNIAQRIISQEADYVLALKANQGKLYDTVNDLFTYAQQNHFKHIAHEHWEEMEKDHGRIETRRYDLIEQGEDPRYPNGIRWPGLKGVGRVTSTRQIGDQITEEVRFFITSFGQNIQRFAEAVRGHWNVEIQLHWSLDVSFQEDLCRVRVGHSAENFAVIRRIALNMLKSERSAKIGIAAKRKKAGWDESYLTQVVATLG